MISENGLDTKNAAAVIGCSPSVLYRWRKRGIGPKFYRVGPRLVRYRKVDVETWVETSVNSCVSAETFGSRRVK